jgi:hypothetical protein
MHKIATVLVAALIVAGAVGDRAEAAGQEWATTGVRPIGQPIAVGGVAVGYLQRDKHVYARGIRPNDGDILWEREVTPSKQTYGVEIVPFGFGGDVFFLEPLPGSPLGDLAARLVVVDAATGRVRHSSPPALFRTTPERCFGDTAVCVMAIPAVGQDARPYRLDLKTGDYAPYAVTGVPEYARDIGERGLIDLGVRPGEEIGLLRDGALRWHRPLTDAFPADFSTTYGWSWTLYQKQGVYAGSVFGRGQRRAGREDRRRPLARGRDTGQLRGPGAADGRGGALPRTRSAAHRLRPDLGLDGDARMIDLTDGAVTAPATDRVYWCLTEARFDFHVGFVYPLGTPMKYERVGGNLAEVCDADGRPVASGLPSSSASQTIGAVTGGYAVVATANGYRGAPVSTGGY